MLSVENVVERVLSGEREAFVQLIEHYRDAVCGVAYHYLGNFDDVQDASKNLSCPNVSIRNLTNAPAST